MLKNELNADLLVNSDEIDPIKITWTTPMKNIEEIYEWEKRNRKNISEFCLIFNDRVISELKYKDKESESQFYEEFYAYNYRMEKLNSFYKDNFLDFKNRTFIQIKEKILDRKNLFNILADLTNAQPKFSELLNSEKGKEVVNKSYKKYYKLKRSHPAFPEANVSNYYSLPTQIETRYPIFLRELQDILNSQKKFSQSELNNLTASEKEEMRKAAERIKIIEENLQAHLNIINESMNEVQKNSEYVRKVNQNNFEKLVTGLNKLLNDYLNNEKGYVLTHRNKMIIDKINEVLIKINEVKNKGSDLESKNALIEVVKIINDIELLNPEEEVKPSCIGVGFKVDKFQKLINKLNHFMLSSDAIRHYQEVVKNRIWVAKEADLEERRQLRLMQDNVYLNSDCKLHNS